MIAKLVSAIAIGVLASATAARAEPIAVRGGTVWVDAETGIIENATVLVDDGVIIAVGDSSIEIPANSTEIDATGKWVTPGIISAFARVGLVEIGAEDATNDTAATGDAVKFSAALNAADGFNPAATAIPVVRLDGVTRVAVTPSPGTRLFAGQGFIATTTGTPGSILNEKAFALVVMGEAGANQAGGSRPAAWAEFEAAIGDARAYPGRFITDRMGDALSSYDAKALKAVTSGEQLLLILAHRASDLRRIIAFKAANPGIRIAIVGADEGWQVADELAQAGIPVIMDPFSNLPATFARLGATLENAMRLIEAGVTTAFADIGNSTHQAHLVVQAAGNAVANGVSFNKALAAITTAPAEIFGMGTVGRIAEGYTADLVIWDGDPLEITSSPDAVMIDGNMQAMESRQTRLRDRYLSLEGDQPFRYRRPE